MPTWTKEQLREYESKRPSKGAGRIDDHRDRRTGQRPVVQEQKEDGLKQEDEAPDPLHGAKDEAVDEGLCHPYRISIVFKVSDMRVRDISGMTETIADCIVAARKNNLDKPWVKLLPPDDRWQDVVYGMLVCKLVSKGQEGAVIVIERDVPFNW